MEGQMSMMPIEDFIPEVVKKHGWAGSQNIAKYNAEQKRNAEYLSFAIQSWGIKRVNTKDPEAIKERLTWYFERCIENNMKPTMSGMASALGVSRQILWDWHNGTRRPENYEIIESAYNMMEQLWEMYMMNGQINPASGIFLGKNHFGYKDVQDIVVQPKQPLGEEADTEAIEEKYRELPPD